MAKGVKIDTSDYTFEATNEVINNGQLVIDEKTGEPKVETNSVKVLMKITLAQLLCRPDLGDDKDYDLLEIGAVAKQIEQSNGHVILNNSEYEALKKRMKFLQKRLGFKYYEMVKRIAEAEKVELDEKV